MTVNSRLTEVKAMVDSVVIPNGPDLVYCLEVIAIQACIDKVHAVKTQLENLKAPVRIVFLVAKKVRNWQNVQLSINMVCALY